MRIMLIDDHELYAAGVRQLLQEVYREAQFDIYLTANDALAGLDGHHHYDLILLDLMLPGMKGALFIKAVEERELLVPVIVLSATESMQSISEAMDSGASGFLPKSLNSQQMREGIEAVLEGQIYVPEEIEKRLVTYKRIEQSANLRNKAADLGITERQFKVLELMVQGLNNQLIAKTLYVSENTVKTHVAALYKRLGVDNRLACIKQAEEQELLV